MGATVIYRNMGAQLQATRIAAHNSAIPENAKLRNFLIITPPQRGRSNPSGQRLGSVRGSNFWAAKYTYGGRGPTPLNFLDPKMPLQVERYLNREASAKYLSGYG